MVGRVCIPPRSGDIVICDSQYKPIDPVWDSVWRNRVANGLTASGVRGIDNPDNSLHWLYQMRVNRCWGTFIGLFMFFALSAANTTPSTSFWLSMLLTAACIAAGVVVITATVAIFYIVTSAVDWFTDWLW